MKLEVAVVKMLDAARDPGTPPTKLARMLDLTMHKVAGMNPNGSIALKIVQSNMLRSAIRSPLKVEELSQVKPKRKRRTKAEMQAAREATLREKS